MYRKLFEPKYQEPAPEVLLAAPEPNVYAAEDPQTCRFRLQMETMSDFNAAFRGRICYGPMMEVEVEKMTIQGPRWAVPVNVYYPLVQEEHPVMIFCHGGGFCSHNPDVYDLLTRYLACYGEMTVVSVDYRLAPEWKFPAGFDDAYQVLQWVSGNLKVLGGKENALSICGDSAGGNLAAAAVLKARDEHGPAVQKQILIFPLMSHVMEKRTDSELRYGKGYFLEYDSSKHMLSALFDNEEDERSPYASPLLAESLKDLPKTCFISAECDPLLDQALMYAARLKDAGVPVEFHLYERMLHGFINRPYGKSFEALDAICRFVNDA